VSRSPRVGSARRFERLAGWWARTAGATAGAVVPAFQRNFTGIGTCGIALDGNRRGQQRGIKTRTVPGIALAAIFLSRAALLAAGAQAARGGIGANERIFRSAFSRSTFRLERSDCFSLFCGTACIPWLLRARFAGWPIFAKAILMRPIILRSRAC
jgi:hypothetical protein